MGAKAIRLTPEQKSEAFRLAIDGGNPLKYLADLGSPSASSLWYTMKKELKLKDPETYEKLPAKYKGMSKAEPTGKLSDKETGNMTVITTSEPPQIPAVKIDGAIRIETPEKNKAEVVETPETPLKAAVVGKPETAGPVKRMKRYTVSAIRFPEIGEFYFDQKYNMIDWRTPEGEEVSMSPTGWKLLLQDLPEIFETLGVEI